MTVNIKIDAQDNASPKVKAAINNIESSMKSAAATSTSLASKLNNLSIGTVALGGAIYAAGSKILAFTNQAREYGDQLQKIATRTGATVEEVDKLRQIAELSGISFEILSQAISKTQKNISDAAAGTGEAKSSFEAMGIKLDELKRKTASEQFVYLAERISGISNESDKAAVAMRVFGESGARLMQMAPGLAQAMENTSTAWSQEAADNIALFNDNLTTLSENLTKTLLPVVNTTIEALNRLFKSFSEAGRAESNNESRLTYLKAEQSELEKVIIKHAEHAQKIREKGFDSGFAQRRLALLDEEKSKLEKIKAEIDSINAKQVKPPEPIKAVTQLDFTKTDAGMKLADEIKKQQDIITQIKSDAASRQLELSGRYLEAEIAQIKSAYDKKIELAKGNQEIITDLEKTRGQEILAAQKSFENERQSLEFDARQRLLDIQKESGNTSYQLNSEQLELILEQETKSYEKRLEEAEQYGIDRALIEQEHVARMNKIRAESVGTYEDSFITKEKLSIEYDAAESDKILAQEEEATAKRLEMIKSIQEQAGTSIGTALGSIIAGTEDTEEAFRKMTAEILAMLIKIAVQKAVVSAFGPSVGMAEGGAVQGFAEGGYVFGAGTSKSDSIPAMLSNGEYVLDAETTRRIGIPRLDRLRTERYATGGAVGATPTATGVSENLQPVNVTFNVNAIDAKSTADFFKQNARQITGLVEQALTRGDRGLRSSIRKA